MNLSNKDCVWNDFERARQFLCRPAGDQVRMVYPLVF